MRNPKKPCGSSRCLNWCASHGAVYGIDAPGGSVCYLCGFEGDGPYCQYRQTLDAIEEERLWEQED